MTDHCDYDDLPLFRRTDPSTSKEAAVQHAESGSRDTNKRIVLQAVIAEPGKTSAEYADMLGMDRTEAGRRLPDLRNDGLVYQADKRVCRVNGTKAMTWFPTAPRGTE